MCSVAGETSADQKVASLVQRIERASVRHIVSEALRNLAGEQHPGLEQSRMISTVRDRSGLYAAFLLRFHFAHRAR